MLFGMFASMHGTGQGAIPVSVQGWGNTGLILALLIVLALEGNALFGKLGPIASVRGVIISSLVLTLALFMIIQVV